MADTWEMLPKSQDDPSNITSAIGQAIDDHNNDVDAHLGPNQAMQSHRASEIIDHLAESIVNDKLKRNVRRYVAIVDPESTADFPTVESAVDYANSVGGGDIYIVAGTHYVADYLSLLPTISLYGQGENETVIIPTTSTEQISYVFRTALRPFPNCAADDIGEGYESFTFTFNNVDVPPIVGRKIRWYEDGSIYTITDMPTSNTIVLDRPMEYTPVDFGFQVLLSVTFTNGSNTVTFPADADANYLLIKPGMALTNTDREVEAKVKEISANGLTVTLETTYTESTKTMPIFAHFAGIYSPEIADMTIGTELNSFIIWALADEQGEGCALRINNCTFPGRDTEIRTRTYYTAQTLINECTFYPYTTGNVLVTDNLRLLNSTFFGQTSGSKGVMTSNYSFINNCRFISGLGSNHQWLSLLGSNNVIDSCEVQSLVGTTITATGSTNNKFINNTITMPTTQKLQFNGTYNIVTSNSIVTVGTGQLVLYTSATRSIVANNRLTNTVSNLSTGSVVVNNITS